MTTAQQLAAGLGLTTADQVEAPPGGGPDAGGHPKGRAIRWTQRRRDIFNFLGPVSLSLVATDGPVSLTIWDRWGSVTERIGHNRGVWPARIVKGSAARDAATTTWNKFPLAYLGTQARLWCLREAERDRLALSIVDLIAARAERDGGLERLEHGFHDLGAELDLEFFEMEMHDVAKRLGILVFDDEGLVRWFDGLGRRFDAAQAERPELRWDHAERMVVKMAMRDVDEATAQARRR